MHKSNLEDHIRAKHGDNIPDIPCDRCPKMFRTKTSLFVHRREQVLFKKFRIQKYPTLKDHKIAGSHRVINFSMNLNIAMSNPGWVFSFFVKICLDIFEPLDFALIKKHLPGFDKPISSHLFFHQKKPNMFLLILIS